MSLQETQQPAPSLASTAGTRKVRQWLDAYFLVAPAVLFMIFFVLYPIVRTIWFSFFDYNLLGTQFNFIGIENYAELAGDEVFWRSLRNNFIILIGSVVFQIGVGAVLAAILNRGIRHGSVFFRTLHFAPVIMSVVAVGILWQLIYDPNIGILNNVLHALNLPVPSQGWLGDPRLAIYSVLAVACWQYTGFVMVILLAGMQSVPDAIYEAARLDGANEGQIFWRITIPVIRNVIIVATLITMIGAFKVFDIVYVLTRGGPANASQVLGTYIYYNAFTVNRAGYASALAVILLIFALGLGIVQLRFSRAVGEGS